MGACAHERHIYEVTRGGSPPLSSPHRPTLWSLTCHKTKHLMDDKWFFHQTSLWGDTMAERWEESGRDKVMAFSGQGMSEWANQHKKHTRDRRQYAERRNTLWWWRIFQILDKSVGEYVDREQKVWKIAGVNILESVSASSQPAGTLLRILGFLQWFLN